LLVAGLALVALCSVAASVAAFAKNAGIPLIPPTAPSSPVAVESSAPSAKEAAIQETATPNGRTTTLQHLQEARELLRRAYFASPQNAVSVAGFRDFVDALRQLAKANFKIQIGEWNGRDYVKPDSLQIKGARIEQGVAAISLRRTYAVIQPELEASFLGCEKLRNTIEHSAGGSAPLNEFHALLASKLALLSDTEKWNRDIKKARRVDSETDEYLFLQPDAIAELPEQITSVTKILDVVIANWDAPHDAKREAASREHSAQQESSKANTASPLPERVAESAKAADVARLFSEGLNWEFKRFHDLAIQSYSEAVRIDRQNAPSRLGLMRVYLAKGHSLKARQEALGFIRDFPDDSRGYEVMASISSAEGLAKEAISYQEHATSLVENAGGLTRLGELLSGDRQFARAAEAYQRAVSIDQNAPAANLGLANSLWLASDPRAKEAFERCIRLMPDEADLFRVYAEILQQRGDYFGAYHNLEKASNLKPGEAVYPRRLAEIYAKNLDFENAAKWYRRALAIDKTSAETYDGLARSLLRTGNQEAALLDARKAIELKPSFVGARLLLTHLLIEKRQYAEADELLRKGIEIDPKVSEFHGSLAVSLTRQKKNEDALAALRRAIELDPSDAGYRFHLGVLLSETDDLDGALDAFRRAVELNPKKAQYHFSAGLCLERKKRYKEALPFFAAASAIEPHDAAYKRAFERMKKRAK
jgi:superkiller protein 3